MDYSKAMSKIYTTLLLFFMLTQIIAQEIPESDSLQIPETENLLMFSISYTSNNMKTKNYEYDRIPALLTDVNYFHKTGLTASINYTNYHKAPENTYETEIQLGYQKNLFPNAVLSTHYARRKFVGDTTYEGLAQKNTLVLNASYTWKFLDIQISNSYLNGKSNNYFLDLDLSASLDFDHVFSENDFLLLNPTLSTTFGTDYWVFQNLNPTYEHIVINYLHRNNFTAHQFEYQSISFFFPIVYNIGNMGFILNWYYSWPSAKLSKLSWEDQSGIMFSVYYTPNI
jgi:hypothetical protein